MDAYKKAGVDINAGYKLVDDIKNLSKNSALGLFGGLFPLELGTYQNPVLVSGTDGVGTKLLIAIKANLHKTIGIDLVAMCVNDVLAQVPSRCSSLITLGLVIWTMTKPKTSSAVLLKVSPKRRPNWSVVKQLKCPICIRMVTMIWLDSQWGLPIRRNC